ncbi:MAG: HAD-IA family hydrolase [Bacteroidota bacterium]
MIKCLLFDCDGTLVDSELLCNLGLEIKLREYGIETSAHTLMEKYRGGKLADILGSIEQTHQITLKDDFVVGYRELVDQLFEKDLKPSQGVTEFLNQNTLPVCVASSGPIKKINKALEITGLKKFFKDHIFSSYEINSWKPAPDIFLHAAENMGFAQSECLVIEDSLKGAQAGIAAKMKTVLFDPRHIYDPMKDIDRIYDMTKLKDLIATYNNIIST